MSFRPILPILVVATSCELVSIRPQPNPYENSNHIPSAAGVMFNSGYDWRKDSLGRGAPVSLGLFKENTLVLKIRDSGLFTGCSDAIRHRLHGGKLYTFCEDESGICHATCNAVEKFAFPACGRLESIEICDSCIMSLESGAKQGWTLRKNGILAAQNESACVISGLFSDGTGTSFSYSSKIQSTGSRDYYKYHLWRNGSSEQIQFDFQVDTVYDIKFIGGSVHCLVKSPVVEGCLWLENGVESVIDFGGDGAKPVCLTLEKIGDCAVCHGVMECDGVVRDIIWDRDGIVFETDWGIRISALCSKADMLCAMCSPNARSTLLQLVEGPRVTYIDEKYRFISPDAFACRDGITSFALNDSGHGFAPVIVSGCDTLKYVFNGFFTCLDLP